MLDEYIYNLPKYYTMMELMFLKELMLTKQVHQEDDICHYWYLLNYGSKFQPNACNRCNQLLLVSINLSDIAVLNIKGSNYHYIISLISKVEAINLMEMLI